MAHKRLPWRVCHMIYHHYRIKEASQMVPEALLLSICHCMRHYPDLRSRKTVEQSRLGYYFYLIFIFFI